MRFFFELGGGGGNEGRWRRERWVFVRWLEEMRQ